MNCTTCTLPLTTNSIRQGSYECQPCHRRTRENCRVETQLGNHIGAVAAAVIIRSEAA